MSSRTFSATLIGIVALVMQTPGTPAQQAGGQVGGHAGGQAGGRVEHSTAGTVAGFDLSALKPYVARWASHLCRRLRPRGARQRPCWNRLRQLSLRRSPGQGFAAIRDRGSNREILGTDQPKCLSLRLSTYPVHNRLSRSPAGKPVDPRLKEFLRYILV